MINVPNEINFLLSNIRAFLSFKIKYFIAKILKGHYFINKNISNYLINNNKAKIHYGSTFHIPGFFNSQIIGKNPIDITKKTPFENDSINTIFSTHVIEHLHKNQIIFFLKECYRVLEPDGVNIIMTPSLSKIIKILYLNNDSKNKEFLLLRQKKWEKENHLNSCSYLNGIFRNYGHRFILDFDFIEFEAKKIGYKDIRVCDNNNTPDKEINSYIKEKKNDVSWNLETETFLLFK
tara:strand:+ start:409 stop:1113 length:705 start_codon:yes stop_codon:yes gene_type:complete